MTLQCSIKSVITKTVKKLKIYLFLLACFSSCRFQSEEADLIIHNATIYTVDENFSIAEAMAVKEGRIIAVGPEREILNKYSTKEKIDAMKRPVYPGFIDAHCHFLGYGESLQKVDLTGTKSFEEVIEKIQDIKQVIEPHPEPAEGAAPEPAEGWLTGRGWDQNDWEVKQFPGNKMLDSLFPDIPVFLKRVDGHAALANSEALKRAGITTATEIPGGIIEVKNGQLTGMLIDNAVDFVEKKIPLFSREQKTKALLDAQQNCFAAGLTTVSDAGLPSSDIFLMDDLQKAGELKMRVYAMLDGNNPDSLKKFLDIKPFKTDRLNVRAFKLYADGALGSRGALLLEEYSDKPGHYGLPINTGDYLAETAKMLNEKGFQMCTHAIGDSAVRMMLNIYAEVLKGTNDKRWRIEHCQVVNPDDLEKFSQYNIIPSVQPTHATSDMYWAEERLGEERVKNAYAYKELFEQNKMLALGTDFPVENISPLKTFYAAVFRMDEKGYPGHGFQVKDALTREEALKGMTIFAAIAGFEENEKGSLEKGKFADFVILDTDIMSAPPEQILKAKVLSTYINGEKVF
jgi:predicted amidohydrolase YtcJ